ncbi:zinc-binding alcohol dehydrogenase [Candidatus Poribacteria bacterium]|nr:zinc-binding alcohol dehydrogenase [Candidatus Poribacteria bacterium]
MPLKSKAIVFTGQRQVDLIETEVPNPSAGEFTIQTLNTLMSMGTEMFCYRGESDVGSHWHGWVKYPFYPGYSCVGQVIKVGDGVEGIAEGNRIFSSVSHRQFANLSGNPANITKIPDDVSNEEAAWCKLATITQTAVRQAEHAMGDTAVVIGLGPIGQLVTQYLRVMGLRAVLAVDSVQSRLDIALAHGATAAFCGNAADAKDFALEHTDGVLADVVYDATGHYAVFPLALPLARRFGKVILLGDSPHPSKQHLTADVLTRQLRVIGTHNENLPPQHAHWTAPRQQRLFLQYLQRKQMRVSDLITHRFKPEEAADVYAQLERNRGNSIGVIFEW